jgi:hypothetical protein
MTVGIAQNIIQKNQTMAASTPFGHAPVATTHTRSPVHHPRMNIQMSIDFSQ